MKNLKINILRTVKKDRYTSLFIVTEHFYYYKLNNEVQINISSHARPQVSS